MSKRVGIIGYGALGQYLEEKLAALELKCSVAFICNRTQPKDYSRLSCPFISLENFTPSDMAHLISEKNVELVIEVAHPKITELYGEAILEACDYMVGSPTVFANEELLHKLLHVSKEKNHRLFIPVGALWGAEDILRMAERDTLKGLKVSMTKHPSCFRLEDDSLTEKNKAALDKNEKIVLYEGPVTNLCKMAPNNVNTMAVAAIAAHNIGFKNCIGRLISDPQLSDIHKIEIEVTGPVNKETGSSFTVKTVRLNPAPIGGVTGLQTYVSFYSSIKSAISFPGPTGLRIC